MKEIHDQYKRDFLAYIRSQWAEGLNWTDEAKFSVQYIEDDLTLDVESINSFYDMIEGRDEQEDD